MNGCSGNGKETKSMRRELPYFRIGDCLGGNQSWFVDPMMRLGGCAAVTACDLSIYLARYRGKRHLYPYDLKRLNRRTYVQFSKVMKPYLRPRKNGVNRLSLYTEGFGRYLADAGETAVALNELSGDEPFAEACRRVRASIDEKLPAACLLLKHRESRLKDFVWHWFLLTGYEETADGFFVKAVTYGEAIWLDFAVLWDTGYEEKGGLILLDCGAESGRGTETENGSGGI